MHPRASVASVAEIDFKLWAGYHELVPKPSDNRRNEMKNVGYSDLKTFGINPLTGEADAFCMRTLCDLNQQGAEMMRQYLGLGAGDAFAAGWNSEVNGQPTVASIMLTRDTIWSFAKFCLFCEGYDYIVEHSYGLIGLREEDSYTKPYLELCSEAGNRHKLLRNPTSHSTQPRVGDRNIHMATGRTD
jgi:hypothetical protein